MARQGKIAIDRRGFLATSAGVSLAAMAASPALAAAPTRLLWLRLPGDAAAADGVAGFFAQTGRAMPDMVRLDHGPTMADLQRVMQARAGWRIMAVTDDAGAVAVNEVLRMQRARVLFHGDHAAMRHAGWGASDALVAAQRRPVEWNHALGHALASIAHGAAMSAEPFAIGAAGSALGADRLVSFIADLPSA
jgi:hypothetical protein